MKMNLSEKKITSIRKRYVDFMSCLLNQLKQSLLDNYRILWVASMLNATACLNHHKHDISALAYLVIDDAALTSKLTFNGEASTPYIGKLPIIVFPFGVKVHSTKIEFEKIYSKTWSIWQ